MEGELKDFFENKLDLEKNLKEYVEKIMYPYTNMEDYIKYGNVFLNLKNKEYETRL